MYFLHVKVKLEGERRKKELACNILPKGSDVLETKRNFNNFKTSKNIPFELCFKSFHNFTFFGFKSFRDSTFLEEVKTKNYMLTIKVMVSI